MSVAVDVFVEDEIACKVAKAVHVSTIRVMGLGTSRNPLLVMVSLYF